MLILDGPMGTELDRRGVATPAPGWSAYAIDSDPAVVVDIHADYARAGAAAHRGNTFRTQPRLFPTRYEELAVRAYALLRAGVNTGGGDDARAFVGCLAPFADCYRPDLSPSKKVARAAHRQMATSLARAGFDTLLCETFPHAGEALIAVEEAVRTGLPTWVAFTAGPDATLMTPEAMAQAARDCVSAGAEAVLVNCTPAVATLAYVEALAGAGVPFGAYANAGAPEDGLGWTADPQRASAAYADLAATWVAAGATLIGSCCGTGPATIAALSERFA